MGKKRQWVYRYVAKPRSVITGQRSSLHLILIPFPSLTSHCFPSDTFPQTPSVVNTVWSRHLSPSCYQTDTQSCCSDACLWRPTSGCLLHLVFHYSFILRAGAASEASRESGAEQSRAGGDGRAISLTAPLDTDFRLHASLWNITSPRPPLQPHQTQPWGSSTAIIILHLGFPCLPA